MLHDMDKQHLAPRLGNLIRHLRVASHLSQEALAARCGLHRTYVGAVERGEKSITVETAQKFAIALDISLSQFFVLLEIDSRLFPLGC